MLALAGVFDHGGFTSCRRSHLSRSNITGRVGKAVARPPNCVQAGADGRARCPPPFQTQQKAVQQEAVQQEVVQQGGTQQEAVQTGVVQQDVAHDIGPNKPPLIRPRGHGMACIWDGGWYRWGGPIRVLFIGTGQ